VTVRVASQQSKAKRALQEIWMAETKEDALAAFDVLVETWGRQIREGGPGSRQGSRCTNGLGFPAEH
jgi:hypothetical protein